MHPDLWRSRTLDVEDEDASGTCGFQQAALRLLPCVDSLSFSTTGALEHYGILAATTSCASATLKLHICGSHNVAVAGMALRNQAAMGRLRAVHVHATAKGLKAGGLAGFFAVLHEVEAIEEMVVNLRELPLTSTLLTLPVGAHASVPSSAAQTRSSLKALTYRSASSDPHLELLLKAHAATLKEVVVSANNVPMALLAALRNLQHLTSPLPEDDMVQLLRCPALTSICLTRCEPSASSTPLGRAVKSALSFFRRATQLLEVRLIHERILDVMLVKQLAGSGQAAVQHLLLSRCPLELRPSASLLGLAGALRGLPRLQHLELDANPPDDLLRAISPRVLPELRKLQLRPPVASCTHDWAHGPAVQELLRRNPDVHLHCRASTWQRCGRQPVVCRWCSWGCHEEINWRNGYDALVFSRHGRQDCCVIWGPICVQI